MNRETELRAAPARLPADLDVEGEVDLGRLWAKVVTRWWLALGALVLGVIVGYIASLSANTTYEAKSIVYLGQPLAPAAGGAVASVQTNLALFDQIVRNEATIRRVAAQVGLRPSDLRGQISTEPILGVTTGRLGSPAPLAAVTVKGSSPKKIERAADLLGQLGVSRVSGYVDVKIQTLKDRIAYDARQLDVIRNRLGRARRDQQEVLKNKTLPPTERLIAIMNFSALVNTTEQRQSSLEQDQFPLRQLLTLAQDYEQGRVVEPAVALGSSARSTANSVIVGAIIGVLVGLLAALLWDPIASRVARRAG